MTSPFDLFMVALAERVNRLWGRYLNLDVQFRPCKPLDRYGVEVMVGLPSHTSLQVLKMNDDKALAVIDMKLLLGAIDRQLGGKGVHPQETNRAVTILEEALGVKLIKKILPGLNEVFKSFFDEKMTLEVIEFDEFSSPWEPTQSVVETSFMGGWQGCEGILRFFWPKEIILEVFKDIELERVDVSEWKPLPWEAYKQNDHDNIFQQEPRLIEEPEQINQPVAQAAKKQQSKRIAFDDFDAMIAALNQ